MSKNAADQDGVRIDEAARQVTISGGPTEERSSARQSGPRSTRRLSGRQRALVAVVGALSIALIGVSAWFLFLPGDSDSLTDGVLQTTVQPSAGDEAVRGEAQGNDAEGNASERDEGQAGQPSGEPSGSSSNSSDTQENAGSSTGASGDSGQQQSATVTVSVSVSSAAVGNPVSGKANPTFNQGATVYDALKATGLSVNAKDSPFGIYVAAIGGLAEFDHGGDSGWKYFVNGVDPSYSAGSYVLQDGDVIAWRYVLTQDS